MEPRKYIVVASEKIVVTEPGTKEISGSMDYKQGGVSRQMYFTLYCNEIPIGSMVMLHCNTPGTVPPLYIPPTLVSTSPNFTLGIVCDVPAGFEGKIDFSTTIASGKEAPVGASLMLRVAYPVSE